MHGDPGYQNWKISIIPWIPQALSIESSVCLACVLKRSVNYLMLLIAFVVCNMYCVYCIHCYNHNIMPWEFSSKAVKSI